MKLLIAAGGSGGHIFPALGFLKKNRPYDSVLFICTSRQIDRDILSENRMDFISLAVSPAPVKGDRGYPLKFFICAAAVIKNFFRVLKIIGYFKPDFVWGFGGGISIPVVLAAWILKVPTAIHEQNVILGRANRLLSRFANQVWISFPQTKRFFLKKSEKKVVFTGNPVRFKPSAVSKEEALKRFDFAEDRFTLLVTGGSQGAHRINAAVVQVIANFNAQKRTEIQIIHITGREDEDFIKKEYVRLGVAHRVFSFLERIDYAYKIADLSISRAGGGMIAELAAFGTPAILIPYLYAEAHQRANAEAAKETLKRVVVIEEKDLSAERLGEEISLYESAADRNLRGCKIVLRDR